MPVFPCFGRDSESTVTGPARARQVGERDDDSDYDVAESLFNPDSMWFVRPQLFFHYTLRPIIGTAAAADRFNRSEEDIPTSGIVRRITGTGY